MKKPTIALLVAVTLASACMIWRYTPNREATYRLLNDTRIDLNFRNTPIADALEEIESQVRNQCPRLRYFRIILTEPPPSFEMVDEIDELLGVSNGLVTLSVLDVPAWDALRYVSALSGTYSYCSAGWVEVKSPFRSTELKEPQNWFQSYVYPRKPRVTPE